ncbi:sensor histidine kinase [Pedobacter sp. KBW01]|uniref:sensor histidine kinase n=1 Tax=Pedobacter sp. KBW01 TaxID=2153364 RepID=UPI000F5A7E0F|nr:histidine kinase [Pedobacter sp. KBW01]
MPVNAIAKILVFSIVLLVPSLVIAQGNLLSFEYNRYNSKLPTNTIYRLLYDDQGILWMATNKGLIEYNGTEFKSYNLKDNDVVNLFLDAKRSELYALGYNTGLSKINIKSKKVSAINMGKHISGALMYGYGDPKGLVFLTRANRLLLKGDRLVSDPQSCLNYKNFLYGNATDLPGFDPKKFREVSWEAISSQHLKTPQLFVRNFLRIGEYQTLMIYGRIYLQHGGRLYSFVNVDSLLEKGTFISDLEVLGDDLYLSIYGPSGGLFLAKGFLRDPAQSLFQRVSDIGYCNSVCKSLAGNIAYSMEEKGLFIINRPSYNLRLLGIQGLSQQKGFFRAINDSLALISNEHTGNISLIDAAHGLIQPLSSFDPRISPAERLMYKSLIRPNNIPLKDASHDGRMRFARNLIRYIPAGQSHELTIQFPGEKVFRRGDYLEDLAVLYSDADSLFLFNYKRRSVLRRISVAKLGKITDIYFLDAGNILICSSTGVFKADNKLNSIRKISGGIFDEVLVSGRDAFFRSELAIAHMDLSSYNIRQIFHINTYSSVLSIQDFDLSQNKIHLLTNKGYLRLDQSIKDLSAKSPAFKLEHITTRDTTVFPISKRILIPADRASQASFVLQFLNPEHGYYTKSYAMTLIGGSPIWNSFSGDTFTVTNTPPGIYTLSIRAAFPGNGRTSISHYILEIKPRFYQTTVFKLLVACLLILVIIALTVLILKRRGLQKIRQMKMELRSLEIENRAFLNQLNPHFLFNALNALQDFIIRKDTPNGIRYLQQVAGLQRNILQFNQRSLISVSQECVFLEQYLYIQQKRFSDKFSFEIHADDSVMKLCIPPMLLQPIIENVIEHGFHGSIHAAHLDIDFLCIEKLLVIRVSDNGRGKLKDIIPLRPEHAMYMIHERLDFLNLKNKTNSNRISFYENSPNGIITEIYLAV